VVAVSDLALELLHQMEASGLVPDVMSYNAAIHAVGGQWERALGLLHRMEESAMATHVGTVPNMATHVGTVPNMATHVGTVPNMATRVGTVPNMATHVGNPCWHGEEF
jgi:hypothetical protein